MSEVATEVDVELAVAPPSPETSARVDGPPSPLESAATTTHLGGRHPPHAPLRETSSPPSAEMPGAASEPGASEGTWTFSPSGEPTGGGPLSGTALNDAVRAGVHATLEQERSDRPRNRRIIPPFSQHDLELGLVPGGALATLTKDLVRRSRVPTEGHAFLRIDSDGAGIVAAVHVLEVSAGRPEWDEVAAQIAAEARSKPMRVPSGAHGVSVTIEVTSAMKTVDGGTPTHSTVGAVVGAITDPIDTAIGLAARVPPVHVVAARVVDVEAF